MTSWDIWSIRFPTACSLGENVEVMQTMALITVAESMPTAPGEEAAKSAFLAHHVERPVELTANDNPKVRNSDG